MGELSDAKHVRLLLVDDSPAVLRHVMQLLPDEFEIVGVLESGTGLLAASRELQPDVVVLDITLPGQSGIALASQLTKGGNSPRIVFLTVHNDADYARAALAAGGRGYVVKMRMSLDLVPALHAVLEGKRFVSPSPELRIE